MEKLRLLEGLDVFQVIPEQMSSNSGLSELMQLMPSPEGNPPKMTGFLKVMWGIRVCNGAETGASGLPAQGSLCHLLAQYACLG